MTFKSTPSQLTLAAHCHWWALCGDSCHWGHSCFPGSPAPLLQLCLGMLTLFQGPRAGSTSWNTWSIILCHFQSSRSPFSSWLHVPMASPSAWSKDQVAGNYVAQTVVLDLVFWMRRVATTQLVKRIPRETHRSQLLVWATLQAQFCLCLRPAWLSQPHWYENSHSWLPRRHTVWPSCRTHIRCWVAAPANQTASLCEPSLHPTLSFENVVFNLTFMEVSGLKFQGRIWTKYAFHIGQQFIYLLLMTLYLAAKEI